MSNTVIKIENLSKVYRLGEVGTGTLSHDLNRFWKMNILGQDDPYALVGGVNDRTAPPRPSPKGRGIIPPSGGKRGAAEYVSALKDINLEVREGEVLGIIGKNGAGKSTLLKLLSRVTSPTTGTIKVKGRLASLLEVGTGFHPEMTGRENIYMNGTIMGMRKWEIDRKLDEIVEFAGVAKYLDTPTKRYSSGMTVRLGFAIAAHLEPEILVVDEVLAVGDAEFQKKAIGKMQDVSTNDGRTVLFVSHNMGSVRSLCQTGFVLKDGIEDYFGEIDNAVDHYTLEAKESLIKKVKIDNSFRRSHGIKDLEFLEINLLNNLSIATNEPINLQIRLKRNNEARKHARLIGMINNELNSRVGLFFSNDFALPHRSEFIIVVKLSNHNLSKGNYSLDFNIGIGDNTSAVTDFDLIYNTVKFEVVYDDMKTKSPIAKWSSNWGNNCYKNVDIEVL